MMYRALLVAVLSLILVAFAVPDAFAHLPPPPKDVTADCSPGFYKNHTDTWDDGICCTGDALTSGTACNVIFNQLNAQGPGSGAIRGTATDFLNACFVTAAASPCTDD